jgi:hypothetical protein
MFQGDDTGESTLFVQPTGPTPLAFRVQHRTPECLVPWDGKGGEEGYEKWLQKWQIECSDKWVDAAPGPKVRLIFEVASAFQKFGEPTTRYCDTVVKTPLGRGPAANVVVRNLFLKPGKLSLSVYDVPVPSSFDCKNGWAKADASTFHIGEIDPKTGAFFHKDVFLGTFALKYLLFIPKGGPIILE